MHVFTTTIPLSLYIHLPWCVRKCPYCDFNSHPLPATLPEELYLAALKRDLLQHKELIAGRPIHSIFFGGGTPSLFSPSTIAEILTMVAQHLCLNATIEITLEANPGTVDSARFRGFREAGVNRLSIGVQSFNAQQLKNLGRIHDADAAVRAIDCARDANFTNFNLDIMYGLPQQSLTDALTDLQHALRFQPPHLSWYQLTLEPNTFFHYQPPQLPSDETLWEMQIQGQALLAAHQLTQYEVSAYSQTGRACLHNKNYWQFGDYLGIGAGAHSKITLSTEQKIVRCVKQKNPKDYLNPAENQVLSSTEVTAKDLIFEFMLNALRLTAGVPLALFQAHTGLAPDVLMPGITQARAKGLMVEDPERLCVTPQGMRFLNDVVSLFLPD